MHSVAVLNHAEPLPSVTRKNLAEAAKKLGRSGSFLAVWFNEESGRLTFLKVPERIPAVVLAPDLPPTGQLAGGRERGKGRERPTQSTLVYEGEGSDRVARGSVRVAESGWWTGRLEVPAEGDQSALLTIEREGEGATLGPNDAALVIPEGEADAVLALLNGLFAQARRGVQPR